MAPAGTAPAALSATVLEQAWQSGAAAGLHSEPARQQTSCPLLHSVGTLSRAVSATVNRLYGLSLLRRQGRRLPQCAGSHWPTHSSPALSPQPLFWEGAVGGGTSGNSSNGKLGLCLNPCHISWWHAFCKPVCVQEWAMEATRWRARWSRTSSGCQPGTPSTGPTSDGAPVALGLVECASWRAAPAAGTCAADKAALQQQQQPREHWYAAA